MCPGASLVYLRDCEGRGGFGWPCMGWEVAEGGGEQSRWSVNEGEREGPREWRGGMEGWM